MDVYHWCVYRWCCVCCASIVYPFSFLHLGTTRGEHIYISEKLNVRRVDRFLLLTGHIRDIAQYCSADWMNYLCAAFTVPRQCWPVTRIAISQRFEKYQLLLPEKVGVWFFGLPMGPPISLDQHPYLAVERNSKNMPFLLLTLATPLFRFLCGSLAHMYCT